MLWPILAAPLLIPGSSHDNIGVCRGNDTPLTGCPADQAKRRWLVLESLHIHPYVCLVQAVLQPLFWKWPEAELGTQPMPSKW